jgi:4-amino-4-deoxy-L-arabinose transferase-like glycosyltransferase
MHRSLIANEVTEIQPAQRSDACDARSQAWQYFAKDLFALLAIFCLALGCLWYSGAFHGEYGGHPDEAGHYVTGLMFHDYFASFHYLSPVAFAENFYLHYPKVAIGHWPPAFYLLQAMWTLLFSVSRVSLMMLMGALTAVLAFTIFKMLCGEFGYALAIVASLVFVALPAVQAQTSMVMADIPVTLFSLLAALCFGRFLDTGRSKDALYFGLLAAAAIMTKGSALALGLVPLIAIALTRQWKILRSAALWLSAAIVLVFCGPWYWLTRHMDAGAWLQPYPTIHYLSRALEFYFLQIVRSLGWGLACLAAAGLLLKIIPSFGLKKLSGAWAALIALAIAFLATCVVIPTGYDGRLVLPAIPPCLALAVAALSYIGSKARLQQLKPIVLCLVLVLLFVTAGFSFPRTQTMGYAPIAQDLASNPQYRNSVILISSDSVGEGMFISELAMRERRPGHIALRSTKMLADTDWTGQTYRSLFNTPGQVRQFLDSVPVNVVLLDSSDPKRAAREDARLLASVLADPNNQWKLANTYPLWKNGIEYPDAVRMYVFTGPLPQSRGLIHINMKEMLGRSLTVDFGNSSSR